MILVDHSSVHPGKGRSCHMVSDTSIEELHAFAAKLKVKKADFKNNCYTLHGGKIPLAVDQGATLVSSHEMVKRMFMAKEANEANS